MNTVAALYYFDRFADISDHRDQQNVIFLESTVSVINNFFIEMFVNPVDFFKKGNHELLANIIKIVFTFKYHLVRQEREDSINLYLDKFLQQY